MTEQDVPEIAARSLAQRLEAGEPIVVVDVREPEEFAEQHLPGAVHVPLGTLTVRAGELDPARETVVYCHAGVRSAMAVRYLRQRGFVSVLNLRGGIEAWLASERPASERSERLASERSERSDQL